MFTKFYPFCRNGIILGQSQCMFHTVSCILNNMLSQQICWCGTVFTKKEKTRVSWASPFPTSMKSGETRTEALQFHLPFFSICRGWLCLPLSLRSPFLSYHLPSSTTPPAGCRSATCIPFVLVKIGAPNLPEARRGQDHSTAEATSSWRSSAGRAKVCGCSHYNRTAAY
jgi:hypothetical protein